MNFTPEQLRNCRVVQNDPANQKAVAQALQAPGVHPALGGLPEPEREQNPIPALEQKPTREPSGKRGVAVVVTLIRCGSKELDDDNLATSFKSLRDAIATSFGVDDADRRIRWQYRQCPGRGQQGTIVKIDCR